MATSLQLYRVTEGQAAQSPLDLLERAFPTNERRNRAGQLALLAKENYRLYACADPCAPRVVIGLCAVWELADWLFVEHLAVEERYRNQGVGAWMLSALAQTTPHRLCLEVELPESEIARRRIGFYRRNGFFLNEYPYQQPALGTDRDAIPLQLMTTGGALSASEFDALRRLLYREVYHTEA